MNHLDEGTIHAWLDGAVDATQAGEIEGHLAQCAACSAAVAEARGMVAASSRILSALDDVPAGVTPRRAKPPVRQWRAARWVTGIAAALMLAVGVTTWNRNAVRSDMATGAPEVSPIAKSVVSTSSPAAAAAQNAPAPALQRVAEPAIAVTPTTGGAGTAAPASLPAPAARNAVASVGGKGPTPAAPAPAPGRADADSRRELAKESQQLSAAPPPSAPAAANEERASVLRAPLLQNEAKLRRTSAFAVTDQMQTPAGCYSLASAASPGVLRRSAAAVGAVAGAVTGGGERSSTRAARAPAAAAQPSADMAPVRAPALLRLDTLKHPLGFVVRSAASDSTVGWWTRLGSDSVSVDLVTAGIFRFATRDRVACPEP